MDAERWSSVKFIVQASIQRMAFSGSGKTRTLIHNPDDRQTRDKPVLELVTNALKTLTDCSIDMYINDLYGEINDGGCRRGFWLI
jgi:hypothetical protein